MLVCFLCWFVYYGYFLGLETCLPDVTSVNGLRLEPSVNRVPETGLGSEEVVLKPPRTTWSSSTTFFILLGVVVAVTVFEHWLASK